MKYLSLCFLFLFISCSENEFFNKNIFNEGKEWKYLLETQSKSIDSTILILYTEKFDFEKISDTYIGNDSIRITGDFSDIEGELVNRWVNYYPMNNNKKTNNIITSVKYTKIELSLPLLGDEVFWYYLPKLRIDESLDIKESENNEVYYKSISTGEQIEYPYTLKYMGKVYFANPLVKDSCDYYQIGFIFKGNDNKYNGKNCLLKYYFHKEYGFVYIKLTIGKYEYYKLDVIEMNPK